MVLLAIIHWFGPSRPNTGQKKKIHPSEHSSSFGSAPSCLIALSTMLLVSFSLYIHWIVIYWALVVQTLDSAIHWIKHYPGDKYYGNQLRNPWDGDLFGG